MSKTLVQPIGQKRLTNVAIVRLKKHGMRFEIACYKNKVLSWRSGVEKDLDEVLQSHTVYSNVSKGILAKSKELYEAFKTTDQSVICKEILEKGELQVAGKERESQLSSQFRDIATIVMQKTINPETQRPYTISMIERLMHEIHFAIDPHSSSKKQALEVIKELQEHFPIKRAPMRLRLIVPERHLSTLMEKLGGWNSNVVLKDASGGMPTVVCEIDPGHFRDCDALVRGFQGKLEILAVSVLLEGDTNVYQQYDNTKDAQPSSVPETESAAELREKIISNNISTESKSGEEQIKQNKCSTCDTIVGDVKQYREHFKSDWHKQNLRRRTRQLPPLSSEECLAEMELNEEVITMKITVMTADEQFITLDVDQDESVENVKALLEVETSVALRQQQLYFNGKEIRNSDRLGSVGVREGDLIMMLLPNAGPSSNELRINPDGSASDPAAFQRRIQRDSELMGQLLQNDPELAQAIQGSDLDNLQRILRERHKQKLLLRNKQEEELALMYADPFDVESQRKIEAAIRQRGIDENMEAALEHNPEAFARVVMLYVDMEVNGVPLKAFVDSGAQSTIISKSCAERCGLLRLLDQRYRGVAVGVGQSEILGRIHVAPIKIGHLFFPCSFTVLDAPNMEFLFGLDMLRKHQCIIDLKENVLRLGGGEVSVPFLQEKDIPSHILDEERVKQASLGMGINPGTSEVRENTAGASTRNESSGTPQTSRALGDDFEVKIAKLVELGFDLEAAKQALRLFNGNEEQAAAYLFGG